MRDEGIAYVGEEHTVGISAVGAVVTGTGVSWRPSACPPVPAQRFYGNESKLTASLTGACATITSALGARAHG